MCSAVMCMRCIVFLPLVSANKVNCRKVGIPKMKLLAVLAVLALVCAASDANWDDNSYKHWMSVQDDSCPDSAGGSSAPAIVRCMTNGGTGTLTQSCLRTMIDSVSHVFTNYTSSTTVLTSPDNGMIMYKSSKAGHAEQNFINKNHGNLSNFHSLWINNSPCAKMCSKELVTAYQGIANPPVIYPAHFYVGSGTTKEQALMCLAYMVNNPITNFTLTAFDWEMYSGLVDNNVCRQDINTALKNEGFKDKTNQMIETIQKVNEYAQAGKTNCP